MWQDYFDIIRPSDNPSRFAIAWKSTNKVVHDEDGAIHFFYRENLEKYLSKYWRELVDKEFEDCFLDQ